MTAIETFPGARKVAVLILRMGIEKAGPLLFSLKKHEVAAIVEELAELGAVDTEVGDAVLAEFIEAATGEPPLPIGNVELARRFLEESLGDRTAREILGHIDHTAPAVPFQFLDRLDPAVIAVNLSVEMPQTIALVLSTLNVDFAGKILEHLPPEQIADVGVRLGAIDRVASVGLIEVEAALEERLRPAFENRFFAAEGGVDTLVSMINNLPKDIGAEILQAVENYDPDLANEIRIRMFVFEDLLMLDDRQMQLVLRGVDTNVLPLALKGVTSDLREKFLGNLSSRARENLLDEMELLGSVRMADVAEAQTGILQGVQSLEESGELVINRGGDDFVS
jgi:flagellar motor switch protein FliG